MDKEDYEGGREDNWVDANPELYNQSSEDKDCKCEEDHNGNCYFCGRNMLSSEDMGEWEKKFFDEFMFSSCPVEKKGFLWRWTSGGAKEVKSFINTLLLHTKEEAYEAGRKAKGSSWREGYMKGIEEGRNSLLKELSITGAWNMKEINSIKEEAEQKIKEKFAEHLGSKLNDAGFSLEETKKIGNVVWDILIIK